MKALAASALILSLALCASASAREGEDVFADLAARALEGFGADLKEACLAGRPGRVRVAVAETALSTTISPAFAAILPDQIEMALERDRLIQVVPRREAGQIGDIARDLLQGGRAPQVRIDEAHRLVDVLIVVQANEADAQGRTLVRVVGYTIDGSCKRFARAAIPMGNIARAFDQPEAFFNLAATALMRTDEEIDRLVVMPARTGIGVMNNDAIGGLQRQLAAAVERAASDRRWRPTGAAGMRVSPFIGGGTPDESAWQAVIMLDRTARGIDARLEFRQPRTGRVVTSNGLFAPDLLGAYAGDPILRIVAGKEYFKVGDKFDFRIELRKRARLFCFILSPDGEAMLIYPTRTDLRARDNVFDPRREGFRFPIDFLRRDVPLQNKTHEFFHCIATPKPLPQETLELWLNNTYEAYGQSRQTRRSATVEMTRRILTGLRDGEDRTESFAELVVVE